MELSAGAHEGVEKGNVITAVCLDYQKAFSKVLQQLVFHETKAKVIIQINNWLKDKKQSVGVNGQFSEWAESPPVALGHHPVPS